MRHARRSRRLSRPSEPRRALLTITARNLLQHGRIHTTVAKAKETQRLVDRLISFGKEGSVHSRRQAYRLLQDHSLVKRLFAEIAPRFLDCQGGYTRVLKLSPRMGDGALKALLELTRLPVKTPTVPPKTAKAKHPTPAQEPVTPKAPQEEAAAAKPKRFFEGLRELFRPKKKGSKL